MNSSNAERSDLPRTIGLWSAVAILVGSVIGSGIFRSPAAIAERVPSATGIMLVWIAGGAFALCGALTVAELAAAYPRSGGPYVYLREAWGKLPAFLYGWAELTIIRAAALGAIATTFAEYFMRALGNDPAVAPYSDQVHYVAAAAILIVGTLNYCGVRWGTLLQNTTTIAKYGALLVIIALAFAVALGGDATATAAPVTAVAGDATVSIGAFGLALVSVLWAYDGWADLSKVSGEVKDPQRVLPRAIIIGTVAVIVVYLLANLAYLSVLSVDGMRASRLVAADVASKAMGPSGLAFVVGAVMISTFGTLNGSLLTGPRVLFGMAEHGSVFSRLGRIHPRFQTPHVAIATATILGALFVLVGTFENLADAFVTAIIPFYAWAVAGIYLLRRRPGYQPPFRVPGYPVVPALFIAATIYLLGNALLDPGSRLATMAVFGAILLGVPVYYLTGGRSRSA
ncbi:MAG: amino acid permease [Gemmatimonadaceae bacterium]|nr:amino acid permease [Gemmatimonadaceae bacterium]